MGGNGINTYHVESWADLKNLFDYRYSRNLSLAFRGQRCEEWGLTPTIYRKLSNGNKFGQSSVESTKFTIKTHLQLFKKTILGRRGNNPSDLSENDLWALGQHHGLDTPLLDWTRSPYIATFFAFRNSHPSYSGRAVWVLDLHMLKIVAEELQRLLDDRKENEIRLLDIQNELIDIVRPDNDENIRLITQGGLFTNTPHNSSLEQWAENYMPGFLHKIIVPDSERDLILRNLDQMNISDATLFPDLNGASKYCNYMLEIHGSGSLNKARQKLGMGKC